MNKVKLTNKEKEEGYFIYWGRKYPPNEHKNIGWSDACWANWWDKMSEPIVGETMTPEKLRKMGYSEENINKMFKN